MIRRLDLAPLDGITRRVWRRVWDRRFGGADRIHIPFFSPTDQHVLTKRDRRELGEASDLDTPLVPQIMGRRADDLVWAIEKAAELGFREVSLNAGCPSGTVMAKGKGAGLLSDPDALDRLLDDTCPRLCLPLSVKTRIGIRSPDEWPRLLEVFARYPLASLTVHVRVAKDKYRGPLYPDAFDQAREHCPFPVVYNGDLRTVEEVEALAARSPDAEAVMIGRGAVADPALFRKLRGGPAADREELRAFTAELYREYQAYYGQIGTAAQRMREVWFYLIHLFEDDGKANKRMRRFRGPGEYEAAEAAIFTELPLRESSRGDLI